MRIECIEIKHKYTKLKLESMLLIVILVCSSLLIIMPSNLIIITAKNTPTNTEKIENDFYNGTLENVTIFEGVYNDLRLDINESFKWSLKSTIIKPQGRVEFGLSQIYGTDKVLLFGGSNGTLPMKFNNTWIFDLSDNTWIKKTPKSSPQPIEQHAMASIWGDDKVLLFGGYDSYSKINDTWIYDLSKNNWTKKYPQNKPAARIFHKMATIEGTDKVMLHGGESLSTQFNDTWVYDLSDNNLTRKMPKTRPGKRQHYAMASVYGDDKVVLHGGNIQSFGYSNETWVYDLSENKWTNKTLPNPLNKPTGRFRHVMATVFGTDKVIIFGGALPYLDENDTWIYDVSDNIWKKIVLSNKPNVRLDIRLASVFGVDKILLFGGFKDWVYYNDTWILSTYRYLINGTFLSSPSYIGPNSTFKSISWNASETINTNIDFQIRSAKTELELTSQSFFGPDGLSTSFYTITPSEIWAGHKGDPWVQYKAYFYTHNYNETPRLKNVTIIYNYWPTTTLIAPNNENISETNKPNFEWNFTDLDSKYQSSFQVLIDDDENFQSIDFDSTEQTTTNTTWQFPNGTSYSNLPDGIWYWKVRTKDNDGDWGLYSPPWKMIIDTKAPNSTITVPINNRFYNNLDIIFGIANESIDGTGINKVEITIEDLNRNLFWNGVSWTSEKKWLLTNGTKKWAYNSTSITWSSGTQYRVRSRATDNASNIEIPNLGIIFIFDMDDVIFSNAKPMVNKVSTVKKVEVGITISDSISGVNGSTIQYAVSYDKGITWSSWETEEGLDNQMEINVTLNHTFLNGTNNRIKWRAKDLVGNGPTESKIYPIKVNTWREKISIPKVRLWSPENGSVLQKNFVELSWRPENWKLTNLSYEISFDTSNPPSINQTGVINTSLIIDNLTNIETYYWTIIPKLGDTNGSCISGVWSFTVDIPRPSVTLISPSNGSVIQALRPTFVWDVNYNGTEELTYDIYVGKNRSLEIEILDYMDTNYLSKDTLVINETYYWKVIPKAGGLKGFESEIWWFTVRPKDYIPTFGVELILEPPIIKIQPGETRYVNATVTNLGEIADKIVLLIPEIVDPKLIVEINEPRIIEVEPKGNAVFNITVQAKEPAKEGEISIILLAASSNAAGYNQVIEKRATLIVKILGEEKHDTGGSSDASWYWIIYLIIFIIIIVIIIVGLIIKRKQKPEPEPLPDEISSPDYEPEVEVPQAPEKVPEVVTAVPKALTTIPTVDTTGVDSTPPIQTTQTPTPMPGQTPQPQIPETTIQPKLPPAQNIQEDQTEVTEQPVNQQISDSKEETIQPSG